MGPYQLMQRASVRSFRRHRRYFVEPQILQYCETTSISLSDTNIVSYGLRRQSKELIVVRDSRDNQYLSTGCEAFCTDSHACSGKKIHCGTSSRFFRLFNAFWPPMAACKEEYAQQDALCCHILPPKVHVASCKEEQRRALQHPAAVYAKVCNQWCCQVWTGTDRDPPQNNY